MRFFYPTALLFCCLSSSIWASEPIDNPENTQSTQSTRCSLVLVVDDSKVSAMLPANFIKIKSENLGIPVEVQMSFDPLDALAKAKEQLSKKEPYDVVVTDHDMPGMNGFELATRMRKMSLEGSGKGESPRFILNTANEEAAATLRENSIFEAVFQKKPKEVAEKVIELVVAGTPRKKSLPEDRATFKGDNMESN